MKLPGSPLCRAFFSVLALITLSVCGGKSPSGPGPTVSPSINPGPTPTPTPTADPPVSASCVKIGYGGEAKKCPMEVAQFQQQVDGAIRTLQHDRPEIFNGNYIQSLGSYYVGLIKILDKQGICAGYDGEELAVKTDNVSNEQYDIETAGGQVRFGPVSYRATCYPAAFPVPPGPPIPPPPGCSLPPSAPVACGRDGSEGKYYTDVVAGINEVVNAQPDLFDFKDQRAGGPYIKNLEAYANAVAEKVTQKGYCARWDGKELGVKKGSNEFNEQYAITLSLTHVRRDSNMYRSTCFPAAF